ncbi:MAG: lipase [Archangium sp.]|nr:lipase [Archangium sp.]
MAKIGQSLTKALNVVKQAVEKPAQQVVQAEKKVVGWVAREAQRQVQHAQETFGKSHLRNWSGTRSGQNVGWLNKQPPPTKDATADFNTTYAAAKAGTLQLPAEAKNHRYLLVGGLFTNQYPGYMSSNEKALQARGLETKKVGIDTGQSVEVNARQIRDAIMEASKDGKQVVLVGQSKGGVDITAAIAMYPELKPHVRAVVAMQAPYGGTPIASDIKTCPELAPLVKSVIGAVMKGDMRALTDLSYETRKAFIAKYPYPSDVPTVSLATSRESKKSLVDATGAYLRDRYGVKSDGLVAPEDAAIPGSRVVKVTNMDHAESVMEGLPGFPEHRPTAVTQALIALALQK